MQDEPDRDYQTARLMLERGEPLPLDLVFRLTSGGIDVSEMERKYFK